MLSGVRDLTKNFDEGFNFGEWRRQHEKECEAQFGYVPMRDISMGVPVTGVSAAQALQGTRLQLAAAQSVQRSFIAPPAPQFVPGPR